jgi:hypothetical protein
MSARVVRVEAGERLVLRLTGDVDSGALRRLAEDIAATREAAGGGLPATVLVDDSVEVFVLASGAALEVAGEARTRLYVAGKMTGLPDFGYDAFHAAQAELEAAGYVVESPTAGGQVEGFEWLDYMRRGIGQLIRCDGVAKLAGWEDSRGARAEVGLALALGLPVRPVGEWVEGRGGS